VCMDVSIYVCIYVYVSMNVYMFSCISVHGYMYMYIKKPPKKFQSYLNFMLKTNIDKNKNFNKKMSLHW
jgi:type IV secretory pathway VirB3-like protein